MLDMLFVVCLIFFSGIRTNISVVIEPDNSLTTIGQPSIF